MQVAAQEQSKAYSKGEADFRAGEKYAENPYQAGTSENSDWSDGWTKEYKEDFDKTYGLPV